MPNLSNPLVNELTDTQRADYAAGHFQRVIDSLCRQLRDARETGGPILGVIERQNGLWTWRVGTVIDGGIASSQEAAERATRNALQRTAPRT